jgi:hypothetical protein
MGTAAHPPDQSSQKLTGLKEAKLQQTHNLKAERD